MQSRRQLHTQAVIVEMQRTRDELQSLFLPTDTAIEGVSRRVYPRSRTFRWMLNHPLGRLAGSALISGALSRLPIGRFLARWIFRNRL